MNLEAIELEQIGIDEFQRLCKYWGYKELVTTKHTARVLTPLRFDSYDFLITEFSYDSRARRVNSNHNGKWLHYKRRDITREDITHIAQIAKVDRFKKDHLELEFIPNSNDTRSNIILRFAEIGGEIISHSLTFSANCRHEFSWKSFPSLEDGRIMGLWVPESYFQITE
jgi:hypothetical protein